MTNAERLAFIEANSYLYPTSIADLRWLIAEVRRLQGEYARGRKDERTAVAAWIEKLHGNRSSWDWITQRIERGEHVAEVKDAT